jgi:hypothetical protein
MTGAVLKICRCSQRKISWIKERIIKMSWQITNGRMVHLKTNAMRQTRKK